MAKLSRREIEAYLARPQVAHLVTVRPDGRPHVAPVWFMWEQGRVLVMADGQAVKVGNIGRSPAVALSVSDGQRPYRYVVLEGEATVTGDNLAREVERLCVRYDDPERGPEFAQELLSQGRMVLIDIRIERLVSWKEDQ